jgi:hypothetical protein
MITWSLKAKLWGDLLVKWKGKLVYFSQCSHQPSVRRWILLCRQWLRWDVPVMVACSRLSMTSSGCFIFLYFWQISFIWGTDYFSIFDLKKLCLNSHDQSFAKAGLGWKSWLAASPLGYTLGGRYAKLWPWRSPPKQTKKKKKTSPKELKKAKENSLDSVMDAKTGLFTPKIRNQRAMDSPSTSAFK